uniref:Putative ovule protein n=1 Tax=Solanum chacoense TaxID=4108 RepID=A0A0V0HFV0_SOLCH
MSHLFVISNTNVASFVCYMNPFRVHGGFLSLHFQTGHEDPKFFYRISWSRKPMNRGLMINFRLRKVQKTSCIHWYTDMEYQKLRNTGCRG